MTVIQRTLAELLAISSIMFLLAMPKDPLVERTPAVPAALAVLALLRTAPALRRIFTGRRVMLLGSGPAMRTARDLAEQSNGRYQVVATISAAERGNGDSRMDYGDISTMARKKDINHLVLAFPERRGTLPAMEIMRCRMRGLTVLDVPSFYEQVTRKLYIENITPGWFIFAPGFRVSRTRLATKRVFDLFMALFGLALTLPFLPLVALAMKIDSRGPIFFRQVRTGLDGRPFKLIKLRTMRADAERETGAIWASGNDSRVTGMGRFLRKTRIDEIPQLVNVITGDMSIIGPRPERPEFVGKLERRIPFYYERHLVKPGVTGWAQVCYPYGASVRDALEKLRYDLYYIKNQSFTLDMEIVFRTVSVVLTGRGAR